ncbi:hypothetical protein OG599_15185 [Streptomyces sp. NBC_01335]|uniref:hypothetical protein n=1 Tax=Streptomyces sp. NBC_01335 TaxID=2903828 RepID=UPI002E12D890|nr:hypothetical protein OG599_15185 [Streptomyces sp. NBC_01335]
MSIKKAAVTGFAALALALGAAAGAAQAEPVQWSATAAAGDLAPLATDPGTTPDPQSENGPS